MSTNKKFSIGIEASGAIINERAGVENYLFNIIRALSKVDLVNKYTLYLSFNPEISTSALITDNPNFTLKVLPSAPSYTHFGLLRELRRNPVDLFFAANHTLPYILARNTKYVSMIHGLEHLYDRSPLEKLKLDTFLRHAATKSTALIVPSNYVKQLLLSKSWGLNEERITVIQEGVGAEFYKRDATEVNKVRQKYSLAESNYLLVVSTIHPRKNISKLIEAFSLAIKEMGGTDFKLFIAGKLGWDYQKDLEAPGRFNVVNSVKFIGRVPHEDLPALYSGSLGYINASLEEGFGLPILEAMACETQCAASDIPPFKEISNDLIGLFNPMDTQDIKGAILNLLRTNNVEAKTKLAKDRASGFTWEKTARETLDLFENTLKDT